MPCPSGSVPSQPNTLVEDLLFVHPIKDAKRYQPSDHGELVAAVMQAARTNRSLRALGSNWALSDAGVAQDLVDTSALSMHLSQPFPNPGSPLLPARLRQEANGFLARSVASDARLNGRFFVHVEAGIKIRQLLEDLAGCGLALPTMGDGAGQSLIGAISTGTHGGDLRVPPLVEWIRAVHLVDAAGRDVWVTPSDSAFGLSPQLVQQPGWCADSSVIADEATFAAVRLAVGRMGVIYVVVLEVVEQYTLVESNFEYHWDEIRRQLTDSHLGADGSATGLFNAPLRDLEAGFFRSAVLRRTHFPAPPLDPGFVYTNGPEKWPNVPTFFDANPGVYLQLLADLKLGGLADDLRGGPVMPLHHINIAMPLTEPGRCWIRRRWKRQLPVRPHDVAPAPDNDLVAAVKANKTNPPGIVPALKDAVCLDWFIDILGSVFDDPRKKRLDRYLDHIIADYAQSHKDIGATSGEALFYVLYEMAKDAELAAGEDIAQAVAGTIGGAFAKLARAGSASGPLHQNMLDAHDYDLDGAQAGHSAEYHFDAAGKAYLEFIDDVIHLVLKHFPVFGYLGIRFTPGASALLAMQKFPLTASVEVATARSRFGLIYGDFWKELHDAARARQGIPHWGQEFQHTEAELAALHGPALQRWRQILAVLCGGAPQVFSTAFSRAKGLEPLNAGTGTQDDWGLAVELFMATLRAGDG